MRSLSSLLQQLQSVSQKHNEIAQLSGENFNVFRILNLHASEVRTHTAFIAALLDPKGSHGLGNIFLQLFLRNLNITDFILDGAEIKAEFPIGTIDDGYLEGGNIDLMICNQKQQGIIIENKIYARDQKNQLLRYHNYGRKKFSNFSHLCYLTLTGDDPSLESTAGEIHCPDDFHKISYTEHIIKWLEDCKKETFTYPIIRETITQYIHLIKYLTGQTTQKNMTEEIKHTILTNKENYLNAHLVASTLPLIITGIHQEVDNEIDRQIDGFFNEKSIIYLDRFKINYGIYEEDGYYFKFFATTLDNGNVDNKQDDLQPVVHLLKQIYRLFKNDNNNLGWYYTSFRTFYKDIELQFNLHDPAFRQTYITEKLTEQFQNLAALKPYLKEADNSVYGKHYSLNIPGK